jgi:hypothetical protein
LLIRRVTSSSKKRRPRNGSAVIGVLMVVWFLSLNCEGRISFTFL